MRLALTLCLLLALPTDAVCQSPRPVRRARHRKRVRPIRYPKPPMVVVTPDVVRAYTMAEWEREERIRRALALMRWW